MTPNANCRSCGAPLRWAVMESTGSAFPLDPAATDVGNIGVVSWRMRDHGAHTPVCAIKPAADRALTAYRYTSHFATCSAADSHRRKKR